MKCLRPMIFSTILNWLFVNPFKLCNICMSLAQLDIKMGYMFLLSKILKVQNTQNAAR